MSTIYGLDVVVIPPVLPKQRVDLPNSVYKNVKGKSNAALNELLDFHKLGRPVLVGTTSVDASQAFSDKLTTLGIKHEVSMYRLCVRSFERTYTIRLFSFCVRRF